MSQYHCRRHKERCEERKILGEKHPETPEPLGGEIVHLKRLERLEPLEQSGAPELLERVEHVCPKTFLSGERLQWSQPGLRAFSKLHLRGDMTFQLREKEFMAITGGGISLPSEKVRKTDGTWKVEAGKDFAAWLVLRCDGQIFARWTIGLGKDRNPRYLDGEAWSCSSAG